jgi:hypothetical protein
VRKAGQRTVIAATDLFRVRQARLDRLTIDRVLRIPNRLNRDGARNFIRTPACSARMMPELVEHQSIALCRFTSKVDISLKSERLYVTSLQPGKII